MNQKKRILLTHAYGPKLTYGGRESVWGAYSHTLTKGQDIFRKSTSFCIDSLHILAQNIQVPATVLEFPSLNDFRREITKGYDYLGINHVIMLTERVLEMCRLTRKLSPQTKIILGGYGVVTLPEIFQNEEEQKEIIDYVCRGEGVTFLRSLLGEDTNRPIQQGFPSPDVLVSLGCVNQCEFCSTSSFFKGKHIQVATASEVFKCLKESHRRVKHDSHILHDENLFANRPFVEELGRLIREDSESGLRTLGYCSTTTIGSLADYSDDELVLSGLNRVFLGVESFFSSFNKNKEVRIKETFDRLHRCGITTSASMIVGLDCQNPENIEQDIDYYVSLGSSINQISSVVPIPGTVLWTRYKKEGRLLRDFPWANYNKDEYISAKNFSQEQVTEIIERIWMKVYCTWGHTLMRFLKVTLDGYCYCKQSSNKYLREDRAFFHESRAKKIYIFLKACYLYSPNSHVRKLIKNIKQEYIQVFGKPNKKQVICSDLLVGYYTFKKIKQLIFGEDIIKQVLTKYYYPNDGSSFDNKPCQIFYPNSPLKKLFNR